jgi:GT2 family glycosyltransferase
MERFLDPWPIDQPPVDVIMLTGNNRVNLQRCLESLALTRYPNLTLHLLLNGSGQPIMDYLEELKRTFPFPIDVIAHPINLGIPVGLNYLHTRCSAPLVWRLDDDMTLPPEALACMVATLRDNPFIGAVLPSFQGPSLDPTKPNIYVAALRLDNDPSGPTKMPKFPYQQTYLTNFMGGACVLLRKKVIELVGDYDIRFTPSQTEDMDYGTYIRAIGYDIIVLGHIIALGYPSSFSKASFDLTLGMGFQAHYYRFKWGAALRVLEVGLDRDGRILAA